MRRGVANLPTRREQPKPCPAPPRCHLRRGQTAIEIWWRIFPRGANDTNPAPAPFERPPSPPEQHRALERVRGVRLWQQGDGGGDVPSRSALDSWYGASLGGTLCFINNPTLRLFSHISRTRLHTTSDDDQMRRHKKHKQKTNTITMVVEPLAPPAAWI